MSKLSKAWNDYFYAWGDNDPDKQVWRYGKYVSLKMLHGYDDYVYYRPRRNTAGALIILGGLGLVGATGVGLYKGGSYLKAKYDEKAIEKKKDNPKNESFER